MDFVSDKQGYPRLANQAQLEISHPLWGVIRLKAKDSSQSGFFALRTTNILLPVNIEVKVLTIIPTGPLNDAPVSMHVSHTCHQDMSLGFFTC